MKKICCIVFAGCMVLFFLGVFFSSKYLLLRKLQLNESVLVSNLALFSFCKKNECDIGLQDLLLEQNKMIYEEYVELEAQIRGPFYQIVALGSWVYIYPFYAKYDRFKSSGEITIKDQ